MGSVTPVQGQRLVWEITKTHQRPEVPLPRFPADEVPRTSRASSRTTWSSPASATTNPCRISTYRTTFRAATTSIGVRDDLHPHQVRHTAASLAIASGADVKVVQQMLGHSSATMTLDTYGHLFEDRLDEVGDAMDRAREAARARRVDLRLVARDDPAVAPVLPERVSAGNAEEAPPSASAGQGPLF